MNITNMYNQFKTLGERKPNERIIFSNLSFFVCEGGFRGNNRFRETNVSDISIGCHFLKTICQIRKKIRTISTYPNDRKCQSFDERTKRAKVGS